MHVSVLMALMAVASDSESSSSKWARRTERKRQRLGVLLDRIPPPPTANMVSTKNPVASSLSDFVLETLEAAPSIEWSLQPNLDPQAGGLLKANSARATRKQRQIEAFVHICGKTLQDEKDPLVVDAGSGAGNLAIPLAGLLECNVLAIDVNEVALQRLTSRNNQGRVTTLCADLASSSILPDNASLVCSLHACGAATDLAMRLATRSNIPFVVSPCCTAKALTTRASSTTYGPSASMERSGSPSDMTYPRSKWLQSHLEVEEEYALIAKVADVGLGPQTPPEQRRHQRVAKLIVELDRLMGAIERHNYAVAMFRIKDHGEDYGKSEIMVGVPNEMAHVLDSLILV